MTDTVQLVVRYIDFAALRFDHDADGAIADGDRRGHSVGRRVYDRYGAVTTFVRNIHLPAVRFDCDADGVAANGDRRGHSIGRRVYNRYRTFNRFIRYVDLAAVRRDRDAGGREVDLDRRDDLVRGRVDHRYIIGKVGRYSLVRDVGILGNRRHWGNQPNRRQPYHCRIRSPRRDISMRFHFSPMPPRSPGACLLLDV
jgi:hypothetical protein